MLKAMKYESANYVVYKMLERKIVDKTWPMYKTWTKARNQQKKIFSTTANWQQLTFKKENQLLNLKF